MSSQNLAPASELERECPDCKRIVKVKKDSGMPGGMVYERHFEVESTEVTDETEPCGLSLRPLNQPVGAFM